MMNAQSPREKQRTGDEHQFDYSAASAGDEVIQLGAASVT